MQLISSFTAVPVSTPIQPENASRMETSNAASQAPIQPTVLILDDNDVVVEVLHNTFRAYGYHTLLASTRDQAVEHCQREGNAIQALIADVRLGAQNGAETARMLQSICPAMRIVLISGYPYEHLVSSGILPADRKIGAFLQKPFVPREILALVTPGQTVS